MYITDKVYVLVQLKLQALRKRNYNVDYCSFCKFTLALNSPFLFWKSLVFEHLHDIPETLLCSMSFPQLKFVPKIS